MEKGNRKTTDSSLCIFTSFGYSIVARSFVRLVAWLRIEVASIFVTISQNAKALSMQTNADFTWYLIFTQQYQKQQQTFDVMFVVCISEMFFPEEKNGLGIERTKKKDSKKDRATEIEKQKEGTFPIFGQFVYFVILKGIFLSVHFFTQLLIRTVRVRKTESTKFGSHCAWSQWSNKFRSKLMAHIQPDALENVTKIFSLHLKNDI